MQDDVKASFGLQPDMGRAYRRLAVAHLEAAGFEQPLEILKDLYRQCTPGAAEFVKEAASFKKEYAEAMRKAAYVKAIEEIAGDDAQEFGRLYRFGAREGDRQRHGGRRYTELIAEIPPFKPPSAQSYFARFEDHPVEIHKRVYQKAFETAKARLVALRDGPLPGT